MSESRPTPDRQQDLYWNQLVYVRVSCEYIRRYRDSLGTWMQRFAILRAVASVGALGTWAAVKSYPMVWGGIIAAAQVGDALQGAIPFGRRHQGASSLLMALERLSIDALTEWEDIVAGRLDEAAVIAKRHRMMMLQHEAEARHLPGGLPVRRDLMTLAKADAAAYLQTTLQTGPRR